MAKNKHKHKGAQAQTVNTTTDTQSGNIDKVVFDGGLFAQPTKSASANVTVAGVDLHNLVVAQYTKIAYGTPTVAMPTTETMGDFAQHMTQKHMAIMPNGYMAFDVVHLASLHNTEIDNSNYDKGNGLQCYITAIGCKANKKGVASGMVARLIKSGFTVVENQYAKTTKAFLGRMWVIHKPQPPAPKTE